MPYAHGFGQVGAAVYLPIPDDIEIGHPLHPAGRGAPAFPGKEVEEQLIDIHDGEKISLLHAANMIFPPAGLPTRTRGQAIPKQPGQ